MQIQTLIIVHNIFDWYLYSCIQCRQVMDQLKIYEYNLAGNLQEQIKTWRYYKKTIFNLCKELNISEDIERLIKSYL